MKKIIFGLSVVLASISANASYLAWQVEAGADYTQAGIGVYSGDTLTTILDIAATPTGPVSTNIGSYENGSYTFAVEYLNYNSSTKEYTQASEGRQFTYAELLNLGVLYDNDSWATGAQKALMWNGVQAVPEPTSGLMVLLGMALLGLKRKKA